MVSRSPLERPMTKEESYVQRRQLFKGIWETALNLPKDKKEDILQKPKVIKTLRMDEIDRCPIGKSKKERIRNLRHVCNRILEFCNRQEADDVFYEKLQTAAAGEARLNGIPSPTKKKRVKGRVKRKIKKAKSLTDFEPTIVTVANMRGKMKEEDSSTESDSSTSFSSDSSKPKKRKMVRRKSRKVKIANYGNGMRLKPNDYKEGTAFTTAKRKSIRRKGLGRKPKSASPKVSPQIISV